jgi:hypothetical protein
MKNFWIIGVFVFVGGCKTNKVTTDSKDIYENYQEDIRLSSLPQYPDFTKQRPDSNNAIADGSDRSVDKELSLVKARLIEKNKSEAYYSGYTILVYSGVDRDRAFKTQSELDQHFPDLRAEMQYQQPRYLLKVGKYNYKFESQKNFSLIKSQFPTARIIQDRFQREDFVTPLEKENAQGQN